jgi:UDP-N-acetylmuramoyl-L-alanyl-D-glutamate--2,6-diaminopimelate ligase
MLETENLLTFLKNSLYHSKRPFHFLKTGLVNGLLAQIRYGFPGRSIHIIVITGTDGKTTTSTLLYHILKKAGVKVALLSTVAAYLGDAELETGFHVTTPQPKDILSFLHRMEKEKYTHLILEVTSHASHQFRTWGIAPQFAGITNVANEHLDYHVTYENYLEAKARILQKASAVVLNEDDQSYTKLRRYVPSSQYHVLTYSAQDKLTRTVEKAISERFPENYNRMNARLAYRLARLQLIPREVIAAGIASFPGVPGRMQFLQEKPFTIIVDFAHTPQALETVLLELKKILRRQRKGRLIAVFGCAGLRDPSKRSQMGIISSKLSDISIFTAEDPRTEDVWSIIRQMKEKITQNHDNIISIADRGAAINFAIQKLAQPGDIIGIFGKGHEKSMCFGTAETPWDDVSAALKAVKNRKK